MQSIDKIFNYYETTEEIPFALLSKSVNFPEDNDSLYDYVYVSENIPWTIMSYHLYDTINYWWVLSSLNKDYPFYAKKGSNVKFIPKSKLEEILRYI